MCDCYLELSLSDFFAKEFVHNFESDFSKTCVVFRSELADFKAIQKDMDILTADVCMLLNAVQTKYEISQVYEFAALIKRLTSMKQQIEYRKTTLRHDFFKEFYLYPLITKFNKTACVQREIESLLKAPKQS